MLLADRGGLPGASQHEFALLAENVQHRRIIQCDSESERMRHLAGQSDGFIALRHSLLVMTELPEEMRQIGSAEDANIRACEERQSRMGRAVIGHYRLLDLLTRRGELSQMKEAGSQQKATGHLQS